MAAINDWGDGRKDKGLKGAGPGRQVPSCVALLMGACVLALLSFAISSTYDMLMGDRVDQVVAAQLRLVRPLLARSADAQQQTLLQHIGTNAVDTSHGSLPTPAGGGSGSSSSNGGDDSSGTGNSDSKQAGAPLQQGIHNQGGSSSSVDRIGYAVRFHPNVNMLLQDRMQLDYTCYEPAAGLSSPVMTIITVINLPKYPHHQQFIHNHRLAYAMKHGYRYCEQQHTDPARTGPALAFARIGLSLALLPCTDYLFHADGDALFFNQEASMDPLIDIMERSGVDLLATADIIKESPINFGIYMLRPADWLWQMFKTMYNDCACDWSRLNDWPVEQGLFYDLLVSTKDTEPWANRTKAIKADNWNHLYHLSPATGKELLLHLTGMDESQVQPCDGRMDCKHKNIEVYWNEAVAKGMVPNITIPKRDAYRATPNSCQRIHFKPLVQKDVTYSNVGGRYSSSFLDYQPGGQGQYDLLLGEIPCIGYRDKKCALQRYWDVQRGSGPDMQMMRSREEVVEFFNADGSPKRRASKRSASGAKL